MKVNKELKEYAETWVNIGYQKNTTAAQQRMASVFSILYTQFIEFEETEDQPSAIFDYKTFLEFNK